MFEDDGDIFMNCDAHLVERANCPANNRIVVWNMSTDAVDIGDVDGDIVDMISQSPLKNFIKPILWDGPINCPRITSFGRARTAGSEKLIAAASPG